MDANKQAARTGMMRSAYRSKDYAAAIASADEVASQRGLSADVRREATYIKAKSSLASSQRGQALELFRQLGADPSTAIGAESKYIVIQDLYDTGQSYWLARAYIVLGDAFAERGQYAQAKATFESIRDGYEPASGADDISDSVRMRLERLSSLMQE
jgi:tetratricopeptide (TPR) repeat protein